MSVRKAIWILNFPTVYTILKIWGEWPSGLVKPKDSTSLWSSQWLLVRKETQWLPPDECGCPLNAGPKLAVQQPNSRSKKKIIIMQDWNRGPWVLRCFVSIINHPHNQVKVPIFLFWRGSAGQGKEINTFVRFLMDFMNRFCTLLIQSYLE